MLAVSARIKEGSSHVRLYLGGGVYVVGYASAMSLRRSVGNIPCEVPN
jgi:hypothetical protein